MLPAYPVEFPFVFRKGVNPTSKSRLPKGFLLRATHQEARGCAIIPRAPTTTLHSGGLGHLLSVHNCSQLPSFLRGSDFRILPRRNPYKRERFLLSSAKIQFPYPACIHDAELVLSRQLKRLRHLGVQCSENCSCQIPQSSTSGEYLGMLPSLARAANSCLRLRTGP